MAYDLLLYHALAELKLIDTVNEALLRDVLAFGLHRDALDSHRAMFTRVEYVLQPEKFELAQDDEARDPHVVVELVHVRSFA